jgi:signal transduction histidine kinase/ActR/RegA family two-component response regulator
MPLSPHLRETIIRLHVDSVVFVIAMAGVYAIWRTQTLRGGHRIAARTTAACVATTLAAIAIAEWAGELGDTNDWIIARRVLVLMLGVATIALQLRLTSQLSRYRQRLRRHLRKERTLRDAAASADRANRAKSDFLVTMSHEIRSPLNALLTSADFVLRSPLDDAPRRHATAIVNEGMRLGSALNEILDLRRIEEGRLVLDRVPFSPATTAQEVARLFSARAEEKHLELTVAINTPTSLLIAGDPRRFRQVVINLVDNAIKFTQRGGVTVTVDYHSPRESGMPSVLGLRVRDTGIGIPAAQRAVLFPSSPAEPHPNGKGLGLTIAQELVRLMGGEIFVRSTPGEGTEFAFTLPVSAIPGSDEDWPKQPTESTHFQQRRVLIVDDMAANRVMLQMFLEQQGFVVEHAEGGEQAVQLAVRNRYDAILMDIHMPLVDGYTATKRIRANERPGERSLILAVTASGDKASRERCLSAGMDEHFAKPLDLRAFGLTLSELIASNSSRGAGLPRR